MSNNTAINYAMLMVKQMCSMYFSITFIFITLINKFHNMLDTCWSCCWINIVFDQTKTTEYRKYMKPKDVGCLGEC